MLNRETIIKELNYALKSAEMIVEIKKLGRSEINDRAMVRCFEEIGGIAKMLLRAGVDDFGIKFWRQWILTRDRTAHIYDEIEPEILFETNEQTINEAVKILKELIEKYS